MNYRAKRALGLVSVPTLVIGVILLATGTPVQAVAEVLLFMFAVFVTSAFLIDRFTSDREPVDLEKLPTQGTTQAQVAVFYLLAAVILVVSLKQLVSPGPATDRTFAIAGLMTALLCAFLAFRAYRKMKSAPTPTDAESQKERGNPKAVLIGIIIFAALFIAGNIRRIMSGRSDNVWIGVGQSAIWLPIFGYFGYREYRKMKSR